MFDETEETTTETTTLTTVKNVAETTMYIACAATSVYILVDLASDWVGEVRSRRAAKKAAKTEK